MTPEVKYSDGINRFNTLLPASKETDSTGLINLDSWYELSIHKWQSEPRFYFSFSGFLRVALVFLGMLTGLGGIDRDIGQMGDIVIPKWSSLSLGMAEAKFLTKINISLRTNYSSNIKSCHRSECESFIPDRNWIMTEVNEDFLNSSVDETQDEGGFDYIYLVLDKEDEDEIYPAALVWFQLHFCLLRV